jgi:hypothetical protein
MRQSSKQFGQPSDITQNPPESQPEVLSDEAQSVKELAKECFTNEAFLETFHTWMQEPEQVFNRESQRLTEFLHKVSGSTLKQLNREIKALKDIIEDKAQIVKREIFSDSPYVYFLEHLMDEFHESLNQYKDRVEALLKEQCENLLKSIEECKELKKRLKSIKQQDSPITALHDFLRQRLQQQIDFVHKVEQRNLNPNDRSRIVAIVNRNIKEIVNSLFALLNEWQNFMQFEKIRELEKSLLEVVYESSNENMSLLERGRLVKKMRQGLEDLLLWLPAADERGTVSFWLPAVHSNEWKLLEPRGELAEIVKELAVMENTGDGKGGRSDTSPEQPSLETDIEEKDSHANTTSTTAIESKKGVETPESLTISSGLIDLGIPWGDLSCENALKYSAVTVRTYFPISENELQSGFLLLYSCSSRSIGLPIECARESNRTEREWKLNRRLMRRHLIPDFFDIISVLSLRSYNAIKTDIMAKLNKIQEMFQSSIKTYIGVLMICLV